MCSRVDHLYAFFVQWSPDVYGKEAREQGFVVVEKDELDMIDNFFSDPASCSWEVSSVEKQVAHLLPTEYHRINTRVGYRLDFLQFRCKIDTFKTVPVPKRCMK